ncbi:NAD(P)-dependent oxidoreductase [Chloroflexota bacterium]
MANIEILILSKTINLSSDKIAQISPSIRVIDARQAFDQEIRESWPPEAVKRFVSASDECRTSTISEFEREKGRRERDVLLAQADIACIGFPYPLDIAMRSSRLKWVHQTAAGASNLIFGDLYQNRSVLITTSRGSNRPLPIAEYVIAAVFAFAKEIPQAVMDVQARHLERQNYHLVLVQGKTIGIVGLGGIGQEVARLAKAIGMRVLATRRSASTRTDSINGVDTLFPPQELEVMLAQSDFVAVCTQYTPETERIIGKAQLQVMKPTAYLINIARGELIDEDALVHALGEGWIKGAMLDVYAGEFQKPPRQDVLELPNLILTPHSSGITDVPTDELAELFYENLARFVDGRELINVIDWDRGY